MFSRGTVLFGLQGSIVKCWLKQTTNSLGSLSLLWQALEGAWGVPGMWHEAARSHISVVHIP